MGGHRDGHTASLLGHLADTARRNAAAANVHAARADVDYRLGALGPRSSAALPALVRSNTARRDRPAPWAIARPNPRRSLDQQQPRPASIGRACRPEASVMRTDRAGGVRLRPDLPPQEANEFRAFAQKPSSGKPPSDVLLILACVRIDLSHQVFAKLTINLDDRAPPIDLWVPHHMILMIGDIREMGRAPVVFTPTE